MLRVQSAAKPGTGGTGGGQEKPKASNGVAAPPVVPAEKNRDEIR